MKFSTSVWCGVIAASVAAGCASKPKPEALGPQKLGDAEASRRIESSVRQGNPTLSPEVAFPAAETTPPGLWDGMRAQTFRVSDDLYKGESFALTADDAAVLGAAYGGPGIVATHVGDLDGNGQTDLTFASGSGSPTLRFEINNLDRPYPAPPPPPPTVAGSKPEPVGPLRQRRAPFSYRDPVTFADAEGGLSVRDDARGVVLGTLRDVGGRLTFEPAADLPRNVRERFIEPRL